MLISCIVFGDASPETKRPSSKISEPNSSSVGVDAADGAMNPLTLLADIGDRAVNPIAHPRTSGATLMLAGFLVLGYLSLVAMMHFVAGDTAAAPQAADTRSPAAQ